ncbi:MAG: DUF4345 family protein [Anaerolineae bacterium]
MSLEQLLNIIACILLVLFGLYSLWKPRPSAAIAHLTPDNANGVAEIRIVFGGMSVMMGIAPLVLNQAAAYQVIGLIFLGVFVSRLLATVLDRPQFTQVFLVSAAFELVVGLILFLS